MYDGASIVLKLVIFLVAADVKRFEYLTECLLTLIYTNGLFRSLSRQRDFHKRMAKRWNGDGGTRRFVHR